MPPVRIIARLDIKGENVVKGVRFEGLRIVGRPDELARRYYAGGADEILFMDTVASLYGRNNILSVVEETARDVFVPLTVGGGLRSVEDIKAALRSGADKVAINTAAIARPDFLREAAEAFGSQCIILSIEAKQVEAGMWEAFTDNGRERTGVDAIAWAVQGAQLGAGEILVTSVDREGTRKGLAIDLAIAIRSRVHVPVILGGGVGGPDDVAVAFHREAADAVACATILHYGLCPMRSLKGALASQGLEIRS